MFKTNELQRLTNDVSRLQMEQDGALGLITATIQNLTVINDKLVHKSDEVKAKIADLNALDNTINATKKDNEAFIKNFKKLLEV